LVKDRQEIHPLNPDKIRDVLEETTMVAGVVHQRIPVTMVREIAMVLVMVVPMMVMLVARVTLSVEATTVRSLAPTTMRRMIAVMFLSLCKPQHQHLRHPLGPLLNQPKVKSVQAETIMGRDVVPLKTPVMKEKVTVMAQETVDLMMVTVAASQDWCVAATTA